MKPETLLEYSQIDADATLNTSANIRLGFMEEAYTRLQQRYRSLAWYSLIVTACMAIETVWILFR